MTATAAEKLRTKITAQPSRVLVDSLLIVKDAENAAGRLVHAWIIDELEARFPAAAAIVEKAFEDLEERITNASEGVDPSEFDIDYVNVLIGAIVATGGI